MIIALAVSPSLDVTYEVETLRRGDITRPDAVTRVAGGKALNVIRVAHALGADARAVAALGGRTGAWVADLLAADGVSADIVPLRRETRTCAAIVEVDGGASSTDLYEPATPLSASEWSDFEQTALAAVNGGMPWVVLSGSLPAGLDHRAAAALLEQLRDAGARIAVDSSGEALRTLAPIADMVKVNREEAADALDEHHPDAASAARALRRRWASDTVVTDGVRGAFAMLGNEELSVDSPTARGRFSAGSGDAFLGGLLAGLDRGWARSEALGLARDAAERNARVPGQGVLDGV